MITIEDIKRERVIAVIKAENADKALEFAEGCIVGGISVIEVTFSFPEAERVIAELAKNSGVIVAAGTVLDVKMAEKAFTNGAKMLVSPHTDNELITYAKQMGLPVIQGAITSSEMVNAWKMGVDMVKVFPASSVGGPSYIKAVKAPMPFLNIMTTGGVNFDNFADYLKAGAGAVGLQSALLGEGGAIDKEVIIEKSAAVMRKLSEEL